MAEALRGGKEISDELGIDIQLATHLLALTAAEKGEVAKMSDLRKEHPNNLQTASENVL